MTTRLQLLREHRGWSRAELARRSDLNATTVGLIENRRFHPYDGQLAKLANALGLRELDGHTLLEQATSAEELEAAVGSLNNAFEAYTAARDRRREQESGK